MFPPVGRSGAKAAAVAADSGAGAPDPALPVRHQSAPQRVKDGHDLWSDAVQKECGR